MKSPLSPIVADIVTQDLEMTFLKKTNHQKLISVVFIRSLMILLTLNTIPFDERIVDIFNSYYLRLKFTIELGGNSLNLFDVYLIK